jgi:glutamate 5-kinase
VVGEFEVQDSAQLLDSDGIEFARGLVNFSADELRRIVKGRLWQDADGGSVAESLGYGTVEEAMHRWVG